MLPPHEITLLKKEVTSVMIVLSVVCEVAEERRHSTIDDGGMDGDISRTDSSTRREDEECGFGTTLSCAGEH